MIIWRLLVVIGTLMLVSLSLVACSRGSKDELVGRQVAKSLMGAESPSKPKAIVAVDEEAVLDGYATLVVEEVERHWYEEGEASIYAGSGRCPEPVAPGQERIRLAATLRNDTGHVTDLALAYFGLESQEVEIDAEPTCYYAGDDVLDLYQQLAPGRAASGYVAFDIPADLPELTFMYTPNYQEEGWAAARIGVRIW